jgi:hypothetical protein
MEVRFKPDVQTKLDQLARETGLPSDELVEDAVIGYFDELAYTRELLDRRFEDLESGRVQPIDGEEAYRLLMEKTETQRNRPERQVRRFIRKRSPIWTRSAGISERTVRTQRTWSSRKYSTRFASWCPSPIRAIDDLTSLRVY